MELFYYIYFFEAFISIVLCCILIKYRKPWIIGLWAGLIIANYITCYKVGMYSTETEGLDAKDTLIEMFKTMAFWALNFVPILFGVTVLAINIKKPKFISVIIGIITTIVVAVGVFGFNNYVLIERPKKESISIEEQMKEYVLTYLKEKYGDDINFEVVKIKKTYSYKKTIDKKQLGYEVTIKSDLIEDTFDISIHGTKIENAEVIEGNYYLEKYYEKEINDFLSNYKLECDLNRKKAAYEYEHFPTLDELLRDEIFTVIKIKDNSQDIKTKEEYIEYIKKSTIDFIKYYNITSDFSFEIKTDYKIYKEKFERDENTEYKNNHKYRVTYSNKKIVVENMKNQTEHYEFDISKELEEK